MHTALRGGATGFLCKGRAVEVSLPRNNFPLLPAPDYLFLPGGIGITPILPRLTAAVEAGASATLVYAGRSLATMPFADELRVAHGERVRIHATEERGRPDFAALAAELSPRALVYCCGPTPMLTATALADDAMADLIDRHRTAMLALSREVCGVAEVLGIRVESFDAFDVKASGPDADASTSDAACDDLTAWLRAQSRDRSGIWRDIAVRRRPTEVTAEYDDLFVEAAAKGLQAPVLRAVTAGLRAPGSWAPTCAKPQSAAPATETSSSTPGSRSWTASEQWAPEPTPATNTPPPAAWSNAQPWPQGC
ncbi:ketopantoate reductase C-terminal domain-containing protein [Saccharopolyspora sp. NPDC002376]